MGPTINCEGSPQGGHPANAWRKNPHVQSYVVATDRIGMQILLDDQNVFKCYSNMWDTIYHSELGSSAAILDAGYNIDSLMVRIHAPLHPSVLARGVHSSQPLRLSLTAWTQTNRVSDQQTNLRQPQSIMCLSYRDVTKFDRCTLLQPFDCGYSTNRAVSCHVVEAHKFVSPYCQMERSSAHTHYPHYEHVHEYRSGIRVWTGVIKTTGDATMRGTLTGPTALMGDPWKQWR